MRSPSKSRLINAVGRRSRFSDSWSRYGTRFLKSLVEPTLPTKRASSRMMRVEPLEPRQLLAANPIITEFMANNNDNLGLGPVERDFGKADPFGDGSEPDWIEIFNAGDEAVDMEGYYLTDDLGNLTQWTFPSMVIEPGGYGLVYATGATGVEATEFVDAEGRLHTNFGLRADGENLALVAPDGTTVLSQFQAGGEDYPEQLSDVSYGFVQTAPLLTPRSDAYFWVPLNGDLGTRWTEPDFDVQEGGYFTAGTASMGYEDRPTDRTNFVGQFTTEIPSGSHAAYARMEFDVTNAADSSSLLLRMQYDNGVIVYLNGNEVLRDSAPDAADWFSTAPSGSRRDSLAMEFTEFDLAQHANLLQDGKNVLAVHLLNNLSDNSDMLLSVELFTDKPVGDSNLGYLVTPTPGASNIVFDALNGPLLKNVTQNPGELADDEDLTVTAIVRAQNAPIDEVMLRYRVNFDAETSVSMVDDGTGADSRAGDGIYSATIPASVSGPGDMLRWRVTTFDVAGNSMRWPLFADPLDSDEYLGTVIADPSLSSSNLPVLHWFVESPRSADNDRGTNGSFFYLGEFYDNVNANIHGQSSRSFPKKSYDIDFNEGNRFKWKEDEGRVRDINLLNNWADKGKFRNTLTYEVHGLAGDPALFAFPIRVQQNGEFFSTADFVEDADDRTLDRWGMNPNGALYKMYDTFARNGQASWQKKTRKWEDKTDITALWDATTLRGDDWINYAYDNIDIGAFANFQALQDVTSNHDCCHKNYYFFRDTGQTDEWRPIIWDADLTFGHHWRSDVNYFEDRMSFDNGLEAGSNNTLITKVWSLPGFQDMYYRRLRTLMDQFVQPVDTPYEERYLETRLDDFIALIDPHDDPFDPTPRPPEWPAAVFGTVQGTDDADLDYNSWGSWEHGNGGRAYAARGETMREHIQRVKDEFADQRREFLYGQRSLPEAQVGNPLINFGVIEADPASGNQAEEYIQLINPNDEAVDISGWRLADAVEFTFPGGTVIPAGFTLHVVADKVAFRARTEGPSGGQGIWIVGGYDGELSTEGESLTLIGSDGIAVGRTFVGELGEPTPVQESLKVTEVSYAPLPPNAARGEIDDGTPNAADAFEFVELKNTGDQTLDLSGVSLSGGVKFTVPNGTMLGAGQYALVVNNRAAFNSRYGAGLNVIGEFSGTLGDLGDAIFLDAAGHQPIPGQAFVYRSTGDWPLRAAGKGSSLQVIDTAGNYEEFTNWQASDEFGGSPGRPGGVAPTRVLINEVLPEGTDAAGDRIELFNTTYQDVDISNWYLSNSDDDYFKFAVPAGTTIPAQGYLVFDQTQFGFDLDEARGDGLWLLEADTNGRPTRFAHSVRFETTAPGLSLGPWPDRDSPLRSLAEPTFGAANAGYGAGDVVISEVYYNPLDPDGGGRTRATDVEFVELYNRTDQPIDVGGWQLTGPEELEGSPHFTVPAGTVIDPQQTLVVVGFDPTDIAKASVFKFTFGMDLTAPLYGTLSDVRRYRGLDDVSGVVQLVRPGTPPADDPNFTPLIVVDQVAYDSTSPWPSSPAAGLGDALVRAQPTSFGGFPINWIARPATPGTVEFFQRLAGDANEDGQFDQQDITLVLQSGKYLTGETAGWADGDWTGDALFDHRDIIAALQAGTYLQGPMAALASESSLAKSPDSNGQFDDLDQMFAEFGGK